MADDPVFGHSKYTDDEKPYEARPHSPCDVTPEHSNTTRDQNKYFIQEVAEEIQNVAEDIPDYHPCRSLSSTYLSSPPPDDVIGSLSSHDNEDSNFIGQFSSHGKEDSNFIGQFLSHDQEDSNFIDQNDPELSEFIGSRSSSYCSACLPNNSDYYNEHVGVCKSCTSIYEDSLCDPHVICELCTDSADQHNQHSNRDKNSVLVNDSYRQSFPTTDSCFDIYLTPCGSINSFQSNLNSDKTIRFNTRSRSLLNQSEYSFEQYTTPCSTCEHFQNDNNTVNQILDKAVAADKTLIGQFPIKTASIDIVVDQIANETASFETKLGGQSPYKCASVDNILIQKTSNNSASVDQTPRKATSVDNLIHKLQNRHTLQVSTDNSLVDQIPKITISADETSAISNRCDCDTYDTYSPTYDKTSDTPSKHSIPTVVSPAECRPNFDVYLITGGKLREYKQPGVFTDSCDKYDASDIYTKSYPTDPDLKSHVKITPVEGRKEEISLSNTCIEHQDLHASVSYSDKTHATGVKKCYDSTDSLASSFHTAKSDSLSSRFYHQDEQFITCQDFQEIDNRITSKFSKAHLKEVFNKGRNFVKNKLENYRRRLPDLKSVHQSGDNSVVTSSCGQTCGFSCVHFAKEISQSFSQTSFCRPEPSTSTPNKSSSTSKGDNLCRIYSSKGDNSPEISKGGHFCEACSPTGDNCENGDQLSSGREMIQNKVLHDGNGPSVSQDSKLSSAASIQHGADGITEEPAINGAVTREAVMAGETTLDGAQDDLPVGTEAMCLPKSHYNGVVNGEEDVFTEGLPGTKKPSDKRLRWVSAFDKTQTSSMNSSITSNSSVEELLQQREMDPETLLNNLGFGCNPDTDQSYTRIPDRFLAQPSNTGGVDLYNFVIGHHELHHLLPIWENQPPINRTETGSPSTAAGVQSGEKDAWGRARTLSSVVHGMRFIQGMQAEAQRPRPEVDPHLTELPSILDLPNRKFLAQQGYYGREFIATTTATSGSQSPHIDAVAEDRKTLSATERRKKFHQAVKTARSTNWSFTDEDEDNVVSSSSLDTANTSSGSDSSFDQGLRTLRSFSAGICSESSEDNDSFEAERHLVRQISMRALRQQYQDTIQQSMDENIPVFNDLNNITIEESLDSDRDHTPRITDRRKEQVNRLMSSLDDDGDYLTISIPANQKGMLSPLLRLAQHSTQSTLTGGSPDTPNEPLSDKCLTDGGHFKFPEPTHPKSPSIKPVVSITFDQSDCGNSNSNSETREFTPSESRQLADSLEPLLSTQRSDSCHTLVSQDSSTDHDVSGSVTPRPGPGDLSPGIILQDQPNFIDNKYIYGDALSESTSSSGTLNTMVVVEDLPDLVERRLRSPLLRSGSAVDLDGKQTTLAAVYPPQESFELEEISSADNTFDDFTTCNRNLVKRGPIEKSASIHSDSSGFVDLDTPGEPQTFTTSGEPQQLEKSQQFTPFGEPQHFVDTQQHDCMCANKKFPVRKSKTFDAQYDFTSTTMTINHHHDNQLSQSLLQLPVSSSDRPTKTVQRAVSENLYPTNSDSKYKLECRHDSLKHIHVCNKTDSLDDKDVENQNPTLTSISVVKNVKGHSEGDIDNNKSVMFTIRVPSLEEKSGTDAGQDGRSETKRRYVSTMAINVSANDKSQKPIHHTKQTSAEEKTRVNFSLEHDLSPVSRSDTVVSVSNLKQTLSADNVCSGSEKPLLPSNQVESSVHLSNGDVDEQTIDTRCKPGITDDSSSYKKHILHKRRSKESLIASHNQTADWLLSNQRDEALRSKQGDRLGFFQNLNKGKQMSSSTPNLLDRETQTFGANCDLRKDILTVYFPSTNTPKPNPIERKKEIENDKTLTEIKKTADNVQDLLQNLSSAESVVIKHHDSLDLSESGVCGLESQTSPVVTSENIQHDLTAPLTSKSHVNSTTNTGDLSESGVFGLQSQISPVVKSENIQHDLTAPLTSKPHVNLTSNTGDLSVSGVSGLQSQMSPVVTSENIQHDLTVPLTSKPHVNLTSNTGDLSESGVSGLQSQMSPVVKSENVQHDAAAPLMLRPRLNSSTGNAVDVLGYCKLARLTNAPTISMLAAGQQRFPLMKYQPYQSLAQVRKWHDLNKLKHLEAETSLMQHALQRYKVELTVMETMLLTAIAAAGADLDLEDRAELNDLRSLWSEVKREVSNMEVHLSTRLTSLRAGNDQFSPFNAMSIVQSMIDLLREQLYQQQMCLYKDVNGNDDGILVPAINPAHPSAQSAIAHDVAPNITDDVARSQVQQKEEMERSFTDLKDTLVREVKDELQGNTKWLQLQLQSKDNEIQRLKMELIMQRVNTGETRKRETFESDV